MITITKREELVFNQIKTLSSLSEDSGVYENTLKDKLDISEHELSDILKELHDKEMIEYKDKKAIILDFDKEITTVNSKNEVRKAELNAKEEKSIKIIGNLSDKDKMVSKYILEGHLLYGDLKLSNFRMYHILLSLENKNIIENMKTEEGEYYKLLI